MILSGISFGSLIAIGSIIRSQEVPNVENIILYA